VDRWGIIQWRKFSASDTPVETFTKADYGRVKETGPVKTYTRIVVVYNPDDGLVFEAGSGDEAHTLYIENPFATPQMVQNLYAQLNGFSYAPVDMDVRGYPQFDAGDRIRYGTPAEELTWNAADIAWQDADTTWDGFEGSQPQGITLLMNVRYTFKGGLRMEFEAPARSEQQSEFRVEGLLTQQINRLRATTVREGRSYYGLTITRQRGLEIEREDHKSKLTLNSDEMDWKVNGQSSLYFDAQAEKLKFRGDIEMLGGTINWNNVNSDPQTTDAQNKIQQIVNGTYTGGTFISGNQIYSPNIYGGSISIGSGNNIFRADSAGIWAGHANFANAPFSVNMSGHMKAVGGEFSGTISASTINGGNISGATISGGIITGAMIQGATIQTSVTYPRIELSGNDLFAYRDASNYIMIDPDGPAISAMSGSTVRFYLGHMTYGGLLQSHGYIIISADNGISLQTSNVIEVPSWSQLRSANSYQDLQSAINQIWSSIADLWNALDGKADKGSLTGTAGPYNGGIPIGTNLMTSGGGVVTWSGIPAHSHVQS